jgi:hypothetical protein
MFPNIQLAVNNYIIDDSTKKAHTVLVSSLISYLKLYLN